MATGKARNGKKHKILSAICPLAFLTLCIAAIPQAWAKTVYWTGSTNDRWGMSTANFVVDGSSDPVACAEKDNVVFDDDHAVTHTVVIDDSQGGRPNPGAIVFDTGSTFVLTNANENSFLGWDVKSMTKRGTGRLVLTDCHTSGRRIMTSLGSGLFVENGTVEFQKQHLLQYYTNANYSAGKGIFVRNGGTLEFGRSSQFAYSSKDEGTECRTVTTTISVEKGGRFVIRDPGGCAVLGPLVLNDASCFDFSGTTGANSYSPTRESLGMFVFSGDVTLNGSGDPYVWNAGDTPNEGAARLHLWSGDSPIAFDVSDVTGDGGVDFCLNMVVEDHYKAASKVLASAGFVKRGAGTMSLENTHNAFSGDVVVEGGVLQVGPDDHHNTGNNETYLGAYYKEGGRTVTVKSGAALYLPNRNAFGMQLGITNVGVNLTFVIDGGMLTNYAAQGFLLPDLEFRNGGTLAPGSGADHYGRFMVREHFRVTGSAPFEMLLSQETTDAAGREGVSLNGYPRNVFSIDDVTGDAGADATFGVPFIIGKGFFRAEGGSHCLSDFAFGFTKRGAGTMRYTAAKYERTNASFPGGYDFCAYNGDTDVEEGTLQMDGDVSFSDTVRVSNGAFLSGTGVVNNVSIASGGGMRVRAGQTEMLRIRGDLALGAAGTVEIDNPDSLPLDDLKVDFAQVDGTISGADGLGAWTVKVDGVPVGNMRVRVRSNALGVAVFKGMVITFR